MGITICHRVRRDIREAARESRRFVMGRTATVAGAGGRTKTITTMNYELREKLLGPYYTEGPLGGLRYFENLPADVLQQLIDRDFVELEPWNCCDGVTRLFLPFLRRNPTFTAHGYAVMPGREDVRVSIEGVERSGALTQEEIIDFATTFSGADEMELTAGYARCWYD